MRATDLTEMPLASYNLHGDWSDDREDDPDQNMENNKSNNSFLNRADRRLAQNPRIQERVSKLLLNFPHPIHLYLWNGPGGKFFYDDLDYGRIDTYGIKRLPNELRKMVATRDPRAITVILAHNDGGSVKHPLTPWITLHRIAHALDGIGGSFSGNLFTFVKDQMPRIYEGGDFNKHEAGLEFMNSICTFKAARERKVATDAPSFGEGFTDMFVQYLIKGTVPFNAPPEQMTLENTTIHCIDELRAKYLVKDLSRAVEKHYSELTTNALGKAFIC